MVLSLMCVGQSADGIAWRESPEAAIAEAKRTGKFAAIYFRAEWCQFSKHHEAEVLTDAEVIRLFERFVPAQVDCETQRAVMRRYRAAGHPTVLILDGEGKRADELPGSPTPREYADMLRVSIETLYDKADWEKRVAANATDGEALVRLAWLAIRKKEWSRAEDLLNKAAGRDVKTAADVLCGSYRAMGNNAIETRDLDAAKAWFEKGLTAARNVAEKSELVMDVAGVYYRRQEFDAMRAEVAKVKGMNDVPEGTIQRADDLLKRLDAREKKMREIESRRAQKDAEQLVGPPASAPASAP